VRKYRFHVIDSFMGKLTLQDGTIVGAVLNLSEDTLSVAAEGMAVGTWPLKYCRVARLDESEFVITIDGEPTTFLPVDAFRFAKAAAGRFSASSLADRINVIRSMPLEPDVVVVEAPQVMKVAPPVVESGPRVPLTIAALVVAGAALIALAGRSELGPIPTVVAPSASSTVTVMTVTGPEVFTLTPEAYRERWNAAAARMAPELGISTPFSAERFREQVTDQVLFDGNTDADGTVENIKIAIMVTNDADQGALAVDAIRIALAVAQPDMGFNEGVDLLRRLGFESYPDKLDLGTSQREVVGEGMLFELRYVDSPEQLLLFRLWEDPNSG
jgi:hypothetical protein